MDIQIDMNQIIEKLLKKVATDTQKIATLECVVEALQDELNTYKQEGTLKLE